MPTIPLIWLIGGLVLLGLSIFIPTPGLFALGLSAILVALLATTIPSLLLQLVLWAGLTLAITTVMQLLVPRPAPELRHATEAKVEVTIPPGSLGQVSYEGSIWRACCHDHDTSIEAGSTVRVIGRQGNTLVVVPLEPQDE